MARWGRLVVLTLLILLAYGAFIFGMTALNIGRLPNYFRVFDVAEGVIDALTLSMPLWGRYELLTEQPVLEMGYRYAGDGPVIRGTLEGVYVLSIHVVANLLLMSMLIALYCLLMSQALRGRGLTGKTAASSLLGGGGGSFGVLTAGAASVACCGGGGVSVLLSLLGVGAGIGVFFVEYDRAFGVLGVILMLLNLWFVSHLITARECARPSPSVSR